MTQFVNRSCPFLYLICRIIQSNNLLPIQHSVKAQQTFWLIKEPEFNIPCINYLIWVTGFISPESILSHPDCLRNHQKTLLTFLIPLWSVLIQYGISISVAHSGTMDTIRPFHHTAEFSERNFLGVYFFASSFVSKKRSIIRSLNALRSSSLN